MCLASRIVKFIYRCPNFAQQLTSFTQNLFFVYDASQNKILLSNVFAIYKEFCEQDLMQSQSSYLYMLKMIDRWRRKLGFNFFSHQTRRCEVFPFSSIYVISCVIGLRPILTIDNLIIDRITPLVHSQIKVASHNSNENIVTISFC